MFGKKYEKGFLVSLLASLALHTAGGYEVTKAHEETTQERRHQDSETVKDVIFLPSTEKELVDNLLKQAGVETLEEIQKNPELTKKIDLGYFFIQIEFLEGRITADKAKKAILNLKLKRKVFKNVLETTDDPLLTLNEMQGEIVDPTIFIDEDAELSDRSKVKIENDYDKNAALASVYFTDGITNCYGGDKALISIAESVLPTWQIKINELYKHVRLIAEDGPNSYLVDPGSPIKKVTPEDLEGTNVYPNARLAFLSGILKLPNPSKYYPKADAGTFVHHTETPDERRGVYKRTTIGNYFDTTSTTSHEKAELKALNEDEIPQVADRKRTELPKDLGTPPLTDSPQITKNRQPENVKETIIHGTKNARKEIRKELREIKLKNKSKSENAATVQDHDTDEVHPQDSEAENRDMIKLNDYTITSFHIQEQLMGIIEYPDKKVELEKELMLMFKKIDDLGMLQKFTTDYQDEITKIEPLKPKAGEMATSYLAAKFLVMEYLKKYQELKNSFDEGKFDEHAKKTCLSILEKDNILRLSDFTQYEKDNPFQTTVYYGIKKKDVPAFLKDAEKIIKKIEAKKSSVKRLVIDDSVDREAIPMILDFAIEHPPKEIFLEGEFKDLELLQKFLDTPKAQNTVVTWRNPKIGTSLEKIWKAVQEQKIHLFAMKFGADRDKNVEFPLIDPTTKTVVNVNTPELRKKFGSDFTTEYVARKAMDGGEVSFTNDDFINSDNIKKLSDEDVILIGQKILKFGRRDEPTSLKLGPSLKPMKWLHEWKKMGLLSNLQTCHLDYKNLSLDEITKIFDSNVTLNFFFSRVTDWPNRKIDARLNFNETDFIDLPSIDFLNKNPNITFGSNRTNLSLAITAEDPAEKQIYENKQFEVEQKFLDMVTEFKPNNIAFDIDLSSIGRYDLDQIKCATNVHKVKASLNLEHPFTEFAFSFNKQVYGSGNYGFIVDIVAVLKETGIKNVIIIEHGKETEEQKKQLDILRQELNSMGVKYTFDNSYSI